MSFQTGSDIYKEFRRKMTSALADEGRFANGDPLLTDAVLSGWFNRASAELFTDMPIGPHDHVLDFGCGDGAYASFCAELGASVTLADVDPENLEQAGKRVLDLSGTLANSIHHIPGDKLPVEAGCFSRVLCLEVLEHTREPAEVLLDLARVGAPDALYLISVPAPESERLQISIAPASLFQEPNHIQLFERQQFRSLVEDAGLEVLRQDYTGFFWSVWWILFWIGWQDQNAETGVEATDLWLDVWVKLLSSEAGQSIKNKLDELVPKSQIVLARKPC